MSSNTPIKLNTENEHLLFKAYAEEKEENAKLRNIIQKMQTQIDELQKQIMSLTHEREATSGKTQAASKEHSTQCSEYCTDEEDLAKETEWIRVKSRKKRKMSSSPTQAEEPQKTDSVLTKNVRTKKVPPPPPIIVDGIEDYQTFFDTIATNLQGDAFTTKIMNGKCVKINALNEDTYKSLRNIITQSGHLWHSYENKQERPIRVMVKNLHYTCKPERIIEDLQNKSLKILNAANKISWKKKEPLNMFMLTFNNDEDISKIYGIKSILGCKVEVQPIKISRLVPQCKRCQAYGHTHKYCSKEPRCVKCTGKHLTRDCNKPAEEKPKCVHCGEAHPANYRGCIVAKEMQNIKNKTIKNSSASTQQRVVTKKAPARVRSEGITYAQATAKPDYSMNTVNNTNQTPSNLSEKLDEIIKIMSSFDGRLQKLEKGAKTGLANKSNKK